MGGIDYISYFNDIENIRGNIEMKELKSLKIGLLIFVFMVIVYSYLTTMETECLDKFSISLSLFALFYEAILVVVEK